MDNEPAIRLAGFIGIFVVMAIWELLAPRRVLQQSKAARWLNNIGLVIFNTAILRLAFPLAAVGMAAEAQLLGWGLFNVIEAPPWLAVIGIKFAVILLLGPPLVAVVLFEVILNATAMFNHSNIRLPGPLDRWLRLLIVTPDMHRVHHSHLDFETNSNFGFNLSLWDRLFGTYRAQPVDGHTGMVIGIDTFRDPAHCIRLRGLLSMPFIGKITDYAITRRGWKSPDE